MKYAIVILDGASGWPREEWGDKTSLQQAKTPHLDALVAEGETGLVQNVPLGLEPSSSIACMSIVGYDPAAHRMGRGAIEGAALGVKLEPGQLAMRFNLTSVAEDGTLTSYNTGGIPSSESFKLIEEINAEAGDENFRLVPGVSFRHILVVTGIPELMGANFMAPHNVTGQVLADHAATGPGTDKLRAFLDRASAVLRKSAINAERKARGELEANTAWAVWPGSAPESFTPFKEKYGVKAGLSSGVDLLKGISLLAGVDFLEIDGVTDGYDNDYAAQAEGGIAAFADYDVVILHVESPDSAGHDGLAEVKVESIEAIDREMISRLREWGRDNDLRILALPDHPTPLEIMTHCEDPVPFVMAGPGIAHNGQSTFDEMAAPASGLLIPHGHTMMGRLLAE